MSAMLRLRALLVCCIVGITGLAATGAYAQAVADAKTTEAALFKNGFGFVVREFAVPSAGEHVLKDLPTPVHGTFWILPEQGNAAVKDAVAYSAPRTKMTEALTLLQLVRANVGKRVEVRTEADGWTPGTILAAPEHTPKLPLKTPDASDYGDYGYGGYYGYGRYAGGRGYRPPPAAEQTKQAEFVLLKTAKGVLALPPAEIKGVRAPGGELSASMPQSEPGAALRMKVTGGGGRFRVAYLEWGLTWAPSYRVDISTPGQAALACKGEIMDDVEELRGTTVNFITGFPNLAFAEVDDPMALSGDVSDFIQSLITQGERNNGPSRGASATAQWSGSNMGPGPGASNEPGGPLPMMPAEGEVREDLFLYPHSDVTLHPGERGYYQLFAKAVPYEDIYAWDIKDSLDDSSRWLYDGDGSARPEPEEVWHSLRLTNTGDIPWTTGPAITTQQGKPLGQDTLFYTAPSARTLLKITRSLEIGAQQSETEVARQRDVSISGWGNWDLVTVAGKLHVRNQKSIPITLLVKKTLSGEVSETTPKAEDVTPARGVMSVNAQNVLTWEIKLPPGGTAAFTYQYKAYVRR